MPFTSGVIAFSTRSISIAPCSSTSTKTGSAPRNIIGSTVAINVFAVVMILSPGFMPSAISPKSNAEVPLLTPIIWRIPVILEKVCSNSLTSAPIIKSVSFITLCIAEATSSFIWTYCLFKSTRGILFIISSGEIWIVYQIVSAGNILCLHNLLCGTARIYAAVLGIFGEQTAGADK